MLTATRILRAQWSKTLHLPKSSFPARPLPETSALYLRRCTDELYSWQENARSKGHEAFTLHDGPPYANGPLHIGHALNKITKDLICRFQLSQGKRVNYIPGWDCHGLPIEVKALQAQPEVRKDGEADLSKSAVRVREAARQLATRTVEEQKKGFKEWAVLGDWDHAYKTMERDFEIRQLSVFKQMVEKGLIYRQYKPVYWSPSSATALAEAELEYDEYHKSTAAFVKFPVTATVDFKAASALNGKPLSAVIWTTTPWTLPANKAIAVHNDMEYVIVSNDEMPNQCLLVGKSRVAELEKLLETHFNTVVEDLDGVDLAGKLHYINPLQGSNAKPQPIIHAPFVTDVTGSGLVHLAPGHGMDDYNVCTSLNISAFAPVDDEGRFTETAFPEDPKLLKGLLVQSEGTAAVLEHLQTQGIVLHTHVIRHKYPIDWRTKKPVIVRATEQWFANVEGIKDGAMQALKDVKFIPETGRHRLESFIQGRSQWCISRQRAWGVPIPALYRVDRGSHEATMNAAIIDHIVKIIQERGVDAWWTDPEDDSAWVPQDLEGIYVRGKDTMDVWFDSGTSWTLLPEKKEEPVADVYLEGSDQHRGWFQSSLLTHVAQQTSSATSTGSAAVKPPFKTLITHGFTLDEKGRKMSKSLGNVISPQQIMSGTLLPPLKPTKVKGKKRTEGETKTPTGPVYDAMGADALRLWVASSDYTKDVTIGQPMLQSVNQSLHKYRVTFKWMLGILGLDATSSSVTNFHALREQLKTLNPHSSLLIDQIALRRLSTVAHEIRTSYADYEFSKGLATLNKYIVNDLSAFYFETLKDRVYTGAIEDRLSAQRVCALIFYELSQMLAPVTPLLVEEVWDHVPEGWKDGEVEMHPGRGVWRPFIHELGEEEGRVLDAKAEVVVELSKGIKIAQERVRGEKKMGSGLECDVLVVLPSDLPSEIKDRVEEMDEEQLAAILVVSSVKILNEEELAGVSRERNPKWKEEEVVPGVHGGMRVVVVEPSRHKCDRCWRFVAPAENTICQRCEDVVTGEGTDPRV